MAWNIARFVECFSGTRSPGFDPWCCIKLSLAVHTVIPAPGRQPLGDPVVRYPWLYDELWPPCFKYQTHVLIGIIIIKMYSVFDQTSYQRVHLFWHFSALFPHSAGASQTLCHHFVVLVPDFLKYTTNCHTPQLPFCALSIRSQSSLKAARALSPLCTHPTHTQVPMPSSDWCVPCTAAILASILFLWVLLIKNSSRDPFVLYLLIFKFGSPEKYLKLDLDNIL